MYAIAPVRRCRALLGAKVEMRKKMSAVLTVRVGVLFRSNVTEVSNNNCRLIEAPEIQVTDAHTESSAQVETFASRSVRCD